MPTPIDDEVDQSVDRSTRVRPPWDDVVAEFRIRTTTSLRAVLVDDARTRTAVDDLDACFSNDELAEDEAERRVLTAFSAAASRTHGGLAMAFYLHGRCLEAWEGSTAWSSINRVLDVARVEKIRPLLHRMHTGEADLLRLLLQHAQSLRHAMDVEAGMNCSCEIAVQERARSVVSAADRTLAHLPEPVAGLEGARDYLSVLAATDQMVFALMRDTAEVLEAVFRSEPGARDRLDAVLRRLQAVERPSMLTGDVYQTELRAHRLTLQALKERIDWETIDVERGTVTYVYPFSFADGPTVPPFSDAWMREHRDAILGWRLHGPQPTDVRAMDVNQGLTDMWESEDPEQRGYRGVRIVLPPVTIRTSGGDDVHGEVEIRLSDLGNHHLRVRVDLDKGHPHYLYQAIRRGSPEMGDEELTTPGATSHGPWKRIHDYASDAIGAVADRLRADSIVRGPYHVILCIRQMALVKDGVDRAPARGVDLLRDDVLGASLFWQPVAGPAATLEEWLRYPPGDRKNLVERRGLVGDLVLQTANTTVIAMPGKPSFLITAYEEGAEFTATLRAQLEKWRRQVVKCNESATSAFDLADQEWNRARDDLESGQAELRRIRRQVQSELALLKSSGLCKTPVNREYLDDLWAATGLDREEADLQAGITQAKALYDDTVAALSNIEARHNQRWQARVDYVVAIIAIAGIAELCALVNQLPVGLTGVIIELCLIAVLAVVLATVLRRRWRTR